MTERVWIEDVLEKPPTEAVTLRGILIDLRQESGLVLRCSECKRVLRKQACRIHGEVKGEPDLRIKAVLDDGSGAVTALFQRELTEALIGKTLEQCLAEAKEAMSFDVIRDQLADQLVAQPMEITGKVLVDDAGALMIVETAKDLRIDIKKDADAVVEEAKALFQEPNGSIRPPPKKPNGSGPQQTTMDLFFIDLNDAAQARVLDFMGIVKPEDANLDVVPIHILD